MKNNLLCGLLLLNYLLEKYTLELFLFEKSYFLSYLIKKKKNYTPRNHMFLENPSFL